MMKLSDRIESVQESGTVRFMPIIDKLRSEGREVINFAVGEPDMETPAEVIEHTKLALDLKRTRYSAVAGLGELKAAVSMQFDGYTAENIIISNGSKHALYSIFQVICNPGDEVIILRPYWVSFSEMVKLAGAKPVYADTINHQPDINAIEKAVTPATKAILVNSPNNPTGAVYPEEILRQIADIAKQHNLFLIADEAYEPFIYDGLAPFCLFDFPDIRDRLIVTGSFSKRFAMTGFRIGYTAASPELVQAMSKFQGHCTGNVCTFAQCGALKALEIDRAELEKYRAALEKKRDIAFAEVSKLFSCVRPQGAFYLFPDVSSHLKQGETSADFSTRLLEQTGVAVVPGESFGMGGHVRISYAVEHEILKSGFEKIDRMLNQ